jgi:hypothetical protein
MSTEADFHRGHVSVQLANCSESSVQFFYEFASENARNAVIELQE